MELGCPLCWSYGVVVELCGCDCSFGRVWRLCTLELTRKTVTLQPYLTHALLGLACYPEVLF